MAQAYPGDDMDDVFIASCEPLRRLGDLMGVREGGALVTSRKTLPEPCCSTALRARLRRCARSALASSGVACSGVLRSGALGVSSDSVDGEHNGDASMSSSSWIFARM